jgi:DNA modification methylase
MKTDAKTTEISRTTESTIHQLSPYLGRLPSSLAKGIICEFSKKGDVILDPYCGSGVIPFEATLLGRNAVAFDLNPYALLLTKAKLSAPVKKETALKKVNHYMDIVDNRLLYYQPNGAPSWVVQFFHKRTFAEIQILSELLRENNEYFLLACLLGILHHERPGFLSFPASNFSPYLRTRKYPKTDYPEMYKYKDVRSRLTAKVERAYKRYDEKKGGKCKVIERDCCNTRLKDSSIDLVCTSPPYYGILDYGRDNRLRLWFLGIDEHEKLDKVLCHKSSEYFNHINNMLIEMLRVLKVNHYCVLVLGNIVKNGQRRDLAKDVMEIALGIEINKQKYQFVDIRDEEIPESRRSVKRNKNTLIERVLILKKGKR